ncbi:uncharacterized protein DUF2029 [Luteococcus japonicus]|uniref:Uncharacterized protein DUF2029 n=1 Tax=Luteococcus japonicus TaxID=33984 RepID=A0A3N1ZWQ3_9ACTN|nr:glycosyltransferase family 87 protein [Luteococcus japonicus]ROR55236.1 uncharacterized protein DUF2029 [Luteococcus japonicus]
MTSDRTTDLRRASTVLWLTVAAVGIAHIALCLAKQTPWGQPWRESNVVLLDFRDTIVAPGRFLLQGGNPYDPDTYLTAHPWAQEFDPYSPAWFLLAAPLAPLPMPVSAAIYLAGTTLLLAWSAHQLVSLVLPRWADVVAPAVALWMLVWYPSRVMGSTFLCTMGLILMLRCGSSLRTSSSWVPAAGLAFSLLKPQIGLWVCLLLLAWGAWRVVLRGLALELVLALPAVIACSVSAGGFLQFLDSIKRDIEHASSEASPTGLVGSESWRSDFAGLFMRLNDSAAPSWTLVVPAVIALVAAAWIWRVRPQHEVFWLVTVPVALLLPVHASYDILLAVVTAVCGIRLWRGTREAGTAVVAICAALPVLHIHRVTRALGIGNALGDTIDLLALCIAAILAVIHEHSSHYKPQTTPPRRAALTGR